MESQNSTDLQNHGLTESHTHFAWKSPLRREDLQERLWCLNFGGNVTDGKNAENQLKSGVIKMCVVVSLFLWNWEFLDAAPCVPVKGIL